MSEAGVAVVTHNSEAYIGMCLRSLRDSGAEIVVVDNNSMDRTRDEVRRWPHVKLIANPWNRGFAAAVNQGFDALNCPYVLLLNPDAEFVAGLPALIEACHAPGVAGAAGKLTGCDGTAQAGFSVRRLPRAATLALEALGINRLWPANTVNRRYRCHDLDLDIAQEVEQPAGAFFLVSRAVWQELGGMDESFAPLWFEDVDFCTRATQMGYRIHYVPHAVAKHHGGHSVGRLSDSARQLYWYGTLLMYAAKHFRVVGFTAVCLAVMLGSLARTILWIFRSGSINSVRIYGRVIRLATRCLLSGQCERTRLTSSLAES